MSDNCIPHTMVFLWLPMLPPSTAARKSDKVLGVTNVRCMSAEAFCIGYV